METTNNTPMPDDHNDVPQNNTSGAGNAPLGNNTPEQEPSPTPQEEVVYTPGETEGPEEKSSVGSIIGAIIIVLIIIIGGLFIWGQRLVENGENVQEDEIVDDLEDVDTSSDEIDNIEAELNNSSFDNIDSGLEDIEGEL